MRSEGRAPRWRWGGVQVLSSVRGSAWPSGDFGDGGAPDYVSLTLLKRSKRVSFRSAEPNPPLQPSKLTCV